jgi:hypothetical protein
MSGQEVTIPLGSLNSLNVGDCHGHNLTAGIFDLTQMAGLDGVDGFLSLDYFRTTPVTVDYSAAVIVIEDPLSLARRAAAGVSVGVHVEQEKCSTSLFIPVEVPGRGSMTVEVDSGSNTLILDEAIAEDLGIDLQDESVRKITGPDETGHEFARYFTTLHGEVSLTEAPAIRQANPEVMFQKIIYDGLIGDAFLRNFVVTYDVAAARMIFAVPE